MLLRFILQADTERTCDYKLLVVTLWLSSMSTVQWNLLFERRPENGDQRTSIRERRMRNPANRRTSERTIQQMVLRKKIDPERSSPRNSRWNLAEWRTRANRRLSLDLVWLTSWHWNCWRCRLANHSLCLCSPPELVSHTNSEVGLDGKHRQISTW